MSRALLSVLAAALIAAAFIQPDAALAYDGAVIHRTDGGADVLLAYVDPGAAGFVIVTVLGFVSAIGYTARAYLGRLRRFVPGGGQRGRRDDSGEADEQR